MKKLLLIIISIFMAMQLSGCGVTAGADGTDGSTGYPGNPGEDGQQALYPIMRDYDIITANTFVYYQTPTDYSHNNLHIQEFYYGDPLAGLNRLIINVPGTLCAIADNCIVMINGDVIDVDFSTLGAVASSRIVVFEIGRPGIDSAQQKFLPDVTPIDPANINSFTGIYYNGSWIDLAWTAQYFTQKGVEI